ncbi:GNAT family N-acetyltransferase [Brachybacterium sp. YJGR34]|uniref:GNAT family N-acetyltransferase n=1 Tax=Brachybacterium sp. YJGR34 TaxID=2059911 RepID=UPI000E0BAF2A|nr:GNAT family protein [Brachybacterium sp. YJGR34]
MPSLVTPAIAPGSLAAWKQPVLVREHVTLRPWATDDVPALVAAYGEPDIQQWHARSMTPAEAEAWVAEANAAWRAETTASWAVEVADELAGRITLRLDLPEGCADAAYWTRAAHRGHGVASSALLATAEWAASAGFRRIQLEHSTRNPASCRVAERTGFTAEGTRRDGALHADGWHDMHGHARITGAPPPAPLCR